MCVCVCVCVKGVCVCVCVCVGVEGVSKNPSGTRVGKRKICPRRESNLHFPAVQPIACP